MDAIFIIDKSGEWGCSNHAKIKVKARLVGEKDDPDRFIKAERYISIEKPFMTKSPTDGEELTVITKDGKDKIWYKTIFVSLNNDILSCKIVSGENTEGIEELINKINI